MTTRRISKANVTLWVVQGVLAALFLFAGYSKLAMPVATLAAMSHLPGAFMRFIAIAEIAGALGLVLPGLLRTRVGLTPIAAAGLVIIMIGATTLSARYGIAAMALPFAAGVLAAIVVRGRWTWTRRPAAGPAARVQLAA